MRAVARSGPAGAKARRCPGSARVRDLDRGNLHALHLRISGQELRSQEAATIFQVRALVIQHLALDEILHRIGGDQAGVVARGVSRPEGIAIDQHRDVRAEDRSLPGVLPSRFNR